MRRGGELVKLKSLGGKGRPVIKAGPFGSSITKDTYISSGYKVYGQEQVVAGNASVGNYYISSELFQRLKTCEVQSGDLLISVMGTVGKVLVVPDDHEPGVINPRLLRVSLDKTKVCPYYMKFFLESEEVGRTLARWSQGGTMGGLNAEIVGNLKVFVPDNLEQKRIVELLSTWDRAIDLTERMLAEKRLRRKGLLQQLLTGKRRLPGFNEKWREFPLRNLTTECKARNKGRLEREFVFAVTKALGIVPMKDHVIAEDLDRYKIVSKHCFAYNPMRINVGSICMWRGGTDVLVSPDYVVFLCNEGKLDPTYFDFIRQTHRWDHYMDVAGSGGVRVRIYYDDLGSFQFKIPPFEEQQKIVGVLGAATRELDLLKAKADALREQKKGLMQQLLTGKKRVKV